MLCSVVSCGVVRFGVVLCCFVFGGVVLCAVLRVTPQDYSFLLFFSNSNVCSRSSRGMSVCPGGMLGSGVFFIRSSSSSFHSS